MGEGDRENLETKIKWGNEKMGKRVGENGGLEEEEVEKGKRGSNGGHRRRGKQEEESEEDYGSGEMGG